MAILCLPSGECMCPDATICAALMSALYSTVSEEEVLHRQLTVCLFICLSKLKLTMINYFDDDLECFGQVNISISSRDNYSLEVVLRCLAVEGDGLGSHNLSDGGLLSTVMAAGFKGKNENIETCMLA